MYLAWSRLMHKAGRNTATAIIENAKKEAEMLLKESDLATRDQILREKISLEKEIATARKELLEIEQRLNHKDETLSVRTQQLEKREQQLQYMKEQLDTNKNRLRKRTSELEEAIQSQIQLLQKISGFTKEQAREMLLQKMEEEVEGDASRLTEKIMSAARAEANRKARDILALAIQRCAVDHISDTVVSTIDLPHDDMKGRIIGREGRNIRTFEKATGVDVIIDDTPGIAVVSGFDPIRREIARRAMEKLIIDGRIHPSRIEDVVEATKKEMEDVIMETGKQFAYELNIHNLHMREIQLVGKLNFQSAMGQNLLQHTSEIVHLSSLLAGELGLDITLAKRCAFLHDIGRAVDHNYEGSHAAVGADIAQKCQEPAEVVNAIAAHHEELPARSLYAILLQIAHKIVLERPGSRKEHWERYLKRLERLENVALSFAGIQKAYAIQAGREIRCIVHADKVDDAKAVKLCRNIAKKIGQESSFPGEIKVVIVRETRITEYAK
jgi:ribonuclease Y